MASDSINTQEDWTVRRVLNWTIDYLKSQGFDNPRLDAEIMLAHSRQCARIQLYTQYEEPLSDGGTSIDALARQAPCGR